MTTSMKSSEKKNVKKTVTKKSTKSLKPKKTEPVLDETVVPVEEPVIETKETLPPEVNEEAVEVVLPVEVESSSLVENPIQEKTKLSKKPTKEDIQKQFDELFKIYTDELKSRKQPTQDVSLINYLTKLKNNTFKVLKIKTRNVDTTNKNTSGFMKPVNVSDELRNFIKLEGDEPITRVLITKKLCQYIKDNNLQKKSDRREILPDDALVKLFGIKPNEDEKLTYYSMQKRVQSHIFKV